MPLPARQASTGPRPTMSTDCAPLHSGRKRPPPRGNRAGSERSGRTKSGPPSPGPKPLGSAEWISKNRACRRRETGSVPTHLGRGTSDLDEHSAVRYGIKGLPLDLTSPAASFFLLRAFLLRAFLLRAFLLRAFLLRAFLLRAFLLR